MTRYCFLFFACCLLLVACTPAAQVIDDPMLAAASAGRTQAAIGTAVAITATSVSAGVAATATREQWTAQAVATTQQAGVTAVYIQAVRDAGTLTALVPTATYTPVPSSTPTITPSPDWTRVAQFATQVQAETMQAASEAAFDATMAAIIPWAYFIGILILAALVGWGLLHVLIAWAHRLRSQAITVEWVGLVANWYDPDTGQRVFRDFVRERGLLAAPATPQSPPPDKPSDRHLWASNCAVFFQHLLERDQSQRSRARMVGDGLCTEPEWNHIIATLQAIGAVAANNAGTRPVNGWTADKVRNTIAIMTGEPWPAGAQPPSVSPTVYPYTPSPAPMPATD